MSHLEVCSKPALSHIRIAFRYVWRLCEGLGDLGCYIKGGKDTAKMREKGWCLGGSFIWRVEFVRNL